MTQNAARCRRGRHDRNFPRSTEQVHGVLGRQRPIAVRRRTGDLNPSLRDLQALMFRAAGTLPRGSPASIGRCSLSSETVSLPGTVHARCKRHPGYPQRSPAGTGFGSIFTKVAMRCSGGRRPSSAIKKGRARVRAPAALECPVPIPLSSSTFSRGKPLQETRWPSFREPKECRTRRCRWWRAR